jgi:hypothetical protein
VLLGFLGLGIAASLGIVSFQAWYHSVCGDNSNSDASLKALRLSILIPGAILTLYCFAAAWYMYRISARLTHAVAWLVIASVVATSSGVLYATAEVTYWCF